MIFAWLEGLFRNRTATVFGTVIGIAISVSFVAVLGAFLQTSAAEMTARATAELPTDWQVEIAPGNSSDAVLQEARGAAAIARSSIVGYAAIDGFEATSAGTIQVTGPGKVLGLEPSYSLDFPGNLRLLLGQAGGNLVAQQTAANLHVGPGDAVVIHRPGQPDASVTIDGVVDLPNADSMFQSIGAPVGAAPQAPPDNVLILPAEKWHELFDSQASARPDTVRVQIHARLQRTKLPNDPSDAFIAVSQEGRNFEARIAGGAILANNLAATLDKTREDALYAKVLFLFLGAPGVMVAVLLTITVARSGASRRRRDQSLLRLRGAAPVFLLRLAAAEAMSLGALGAVLGLLLAAAMSRLLLSSFLPIGLSTGWLLSAALLGMLLSLVAVLLPAWWDAHRLSVASARAHVVHNAARSRPRLFLDLILLALSAVVFWRTAQAGYQLVLAPEGVAAVSIDYWAFLAPLLLWLGIGLLSLRLTGLVISKAKSFTENAVRPVSGQLAAVVRSAFTRQSRRIETGVALTALAIGFATSIAIFNATYQAQTRVDAELTNGSDLTVTGTSAAPAGPAAKELSALPDVVAAIPMQHRFAYVGTDLQDLYGIDPRTIGQATTMSNAYFENGDANASLAALQKQPDAVLVSAETVTDFQLQPGDTLNLRLQNAADRTYRAVPFKFVGIVREFPTAPRDSFLVANRDYVAKKTGSVAAEVVLMRVRGSPAMLQSQVAKIIGGIPGATARDINEATKLIGSSLTAIDLKGLTHLELIYAIVLSACAAGLVLALGAFERRRSFVLMGALGAKPVQILAFLRSEALFIFVLGSIFGILAGLLIAWMLIQLLVGVFDPPPEFLTIPWSYFGLLFFAAAASIYAAVLLTGRSIELARVSILREVG